MFNPPTIFKSTVLVLTMSFLLQSGCANSPFGRRRCVDCSSYTVPGCYGFHSTCWRLWPEECETCPSPFASESTSAQVSPAATDSGATYRTTESDLSTSSRRTPASLVGTAPIAPATTKYAGRERLPAADTATQATRTLSALEGEPEGKNPEIGTSGVGTHPTVSSLRPQLPRPISRSKSLPSNDPAPVVASPAKIAPLPSDLPDSWPSTYVPARVGERDR
jgi:hypothetical protein